LHPAGYQHFDGPPQTDYETFDGEEGPSFDDTEFSGDGA